MEISMSSLLVSKKAPPFKASALVDGNIVEGFSLDAFLGKYIVFFFYPLDFTFVCPTELHAFQDRLADFEKRNAQIVGCSVDSAHCHLAWSHKAKESGGIKGVSYPLVSDLTKAISSDFHVLNAEEGVAFRGLFLIDKEGIVRHQLINDLPLGRSVDEALRLLDALIFHEENGAVCPANWKPGKKSMDANLEGLHSFFGS
tara:strand:+ start:122 stop:721 length:600 start_codon:yes stop_codon:yes gene_type:complete